MSTKEQGASLVELILVIAIFAILATSAIGVTLGSFGINRLADQETKASFYAQEGIEAVTSLRNRDWDNLATGSYGLAVDSNLWKFSGSSDTNSIFTRTVTLDPVYRDINSLIVTSGGTLDSDTFKVTSTVTWSAGPSRSNDVVLTTYLTNFHKDWQNLAEFSTIDLTGNQNATKVQSTGNYAYAIRKGSAIDFIAVDISVPASASIVGSLALDDVSANIAVSGNYAYIASESDTQELQIIDISAPTTPSLVGTLDLTGNNNMTGIYVVGTTVYMTRIQASGPNREFIIVDASTPSAPTITGSLDLSNTPNEVFVSGNFAYLASTSNTEELTVISAATPSLPVQVGSLNLSGNDNAATVDGGSNFVVVGQLAGNLSVINTTSPASPTLEGSFSAGADINDLSVGHSDQNAMLATSHTTQEFQVIDISTHSSPSLFASFNAADVLLGIGYNALKDWAVAVGQSNTEEFVIYGPQ